MSNSIPNSVTAMMLSGLYIYPIKSAGGIALDGATVESRGLQYDRRWMVVDPNYKFMTQRQFPQMALMQVRLEVDHLAIAAPGMSPLTVRLQPPATEAVTVEVWGDRCQAIPVGAESQSWLSQFLGTPCQLVYMPDESDRPVDHGRIGPEHQVGFADAYPFLLISEASLQDLNHRLQQPVPMNRFRPNLVVTGCDAFAEDTWQHITIGNIGFQVAKSCSRCTVPTVDQQTGQRGKEPLLTLATYRLWDGQIWFGQNLIQQQQGTLRVGDRLQVMSSNCQDR